MDAERRARWTVIAALAAVVAADLVATRHLLRLVSWPNDLSFHHSMVDWADGQLRHGHLPTGGWYPRLSGGLPQFRSYQSLPHLLTALIGLVIGPEAALHGTLWLLVGTWPIAVYLGGRALGLDRRAALVSAVGAPLVRSATGYGFEPSSYLWLGNGLWSQAWGMWTAPLALGWSAAAVRDGRRYGRAVAAIALTVAFHLPTAWFVLVALGLWVVVRPSRWRTALPRTAGIGVLSLVASSWMLVPFLTDRWATNASSFNGQGDFADSFGWRRVGGWLLAGDIVDAGRIPVLSAVAAIGLVVVIRRWRADSGGGREVAAVGALALVLFIGRDPFRLVIALLPGSSEVFLHRYVAPLQLALVWLVGIGAVAVADGCARLAPSSAARWARPVATCVLLAIVVATPARSTARLLDEDARWVALQAQADATVGRDAERLVAIARARGGGRVFAGRLHDGAAPRIGSVPGPIWLAHEPVDAIGFTLRVSALAADLESYLDPTSVADLDAFGIRYVLVARGQQPPTGAWFLAARGDVQLWEVPGDGLLSTARLVGPVKAVSRDHLAADLLPLMRAQGGSPAEVQLLDFEGRSPAATVQRRSPSIEHPGRILRQDVDLDAGRVDAVVEFEHPGVLVVKANWNPGWRARVDGAEAPVVAVAPTWLAVPVAPGRHHVALGFRSPGGQPLLVLLSLGAVVAASVWSRLAEAGRRPGSRSRARRARPPRSGVAAAAAVALLLAGCGTPHHLTPVTVAGPPPDGPLARVALGRTDSFATLDRVLAPTTRTVVVVASSAVDTFGVLEPLADAARASPGFSVLVLTPPDAEPVVAQVTASLALDRWEVRDPEALAAITQLGDGSGVVVLDEAGRLQGRWSPDDARHHLDTLIKEARR